MARQPTCTVHPDGVTSKAPGGLFFDHPRMRIATADDVVVALWLAPPSAEDMKEMRKVIRPFVAGRSTFGALNLIDIDHVAPLDNEAREAMAETQREFEGRQLGLANVIGGEGFMAAAVRSVAAGVALVSRVSFPQRVFHAVEPASVWLGSLFASGHVRETEIQRVAALVRRAS